MHLRHNMGTRATVRLSSQPQYQDRLAPTPQEIESINCAIQIPNISEDPMLIRKGEHFYQILPVTSIPNIQRHDGNQPSQVIKPSHPQLYSSCVSVDPDHILTEQVC